MSETFVLRATNLRFGWARNRQVIAIDDFYMAPQERVFLRGPSGSGKSTFLSLIAGVLSADAGEIELLGKNVTHLSAGQRDALRAAQLGVIFQMFNLVPYLSVFDNVALPCRFSLDRRRRAIARSRSLNDEILRLLQRLGLEGREIVGRKVSELSVGQQQRVAAARALIGAPALIIADEPTSSLDADARTAFIDLLLEECASVRSALLFVSHDRSLASRFDRQVNLPDINHVSVVAS